MRKGLIILGSSLMALTACGDAGQDESTAEYATTDMATSEEAMSADSATGELSILNERPEIPVSVPKMAYVYSYGFAMPGEDIAELQQRHADMCEAQGPYTCQILGMSHSGEEDGVASGRLELAVASDKARKFVGDLSGAAEKAGGEQVSADIAGEDLSRRIVDTEARLHSRIELRDRLMEVLRTRRGYIKELVEAERQVAAINEEIDQARTWMKEMQGRVAYARVNLDYRSSTAPAGDFLSPVAAAFGSLGSIFGTLLALMVYLLAIGVPLGFAVYGARRLALRLGWVEPKSA